MAKFLALVAVFSIISLVAVEASVHRTIITTKIEEAENPTGQKCRQQIQEQDLSHCEMYITQSMGFNPEHRQQCCQQLRKMDGECRCDALMEIVQRQQQQQHGQMESEEMREMMRRAQSIPTYCHMERCEWSEMSDNVDCRQEVQRHDISKCGRFITGSGLGMMKMDQRCCQQLSHVDKQCRCEALKEMVREEQQQGGQDQGKEMQEMMHKAQMIPRMCNMEPKSCQWRVMLY